MTNGEFVSSILNDLKLLVKDTWISKRHVLHVGKSKAKMLLAQRVDEFKLRRAFDLVSTIPCLEMEEVDRITCDIIDIRNCNTLYKSVKKIPETIYGRTANAIFSVSSVDDSILFQLSTPENINNRKSLKYKRTNKQEFFYFIENGYMYITTDVEVVKIRLIALNEEEVDDCNCSKNKDRECLSMWDMKFPITDLLLDSVRMQTLQELTSTYMQINKDENPNMDENQKSATVK